MIELAVAVALVVPATCPATDARAELLSLHEKTRQAHLRGDAAMIAETIGAQLLFAEDGVLRRQTRAEVAKFFTAYFQRVRYREWSDASPPVVTVSPDGHIAWMAVAVDAKYTRADKPGEADKSFKSSWIATYRRDNCAWRMTGMASDVVETKPAGS